MSQNDEHHDQTNNSRWPEYFMLAKKSLAICRSYEPQIVIVPDHPQKVHAAAFFAKILRDTEAALLLLGFGMLSQAVRCFVSRLNVKSLLRSVACR